MEQAHGMDSESLVARREAVLKALDTVDINRISTVFGASEELYVPKDRDATVEILDIMLSFFRDAVHLAAGSSDILNRSIRPTIESISKRRSFSRNLELLNMIFETRRAIQRNANEKLALDHLFMNIAALET
jgi:hypothetical protein